MRRILVIFICFIGRILLSFRYRVKVVGKKSLNKKSLSRNDGILFLPNHPAHIDPILVTTLLWPKFQLRPLVVEYIYRQSGINTIMKLVGALSMPNFDTSLNEVKLKKAKATIQEIIDGIKNKKNYLLYPAGRLKHTGKEILGGSSATHTIIKACPDINIVLIRTTGLWGSSFSRAYTGKSPDFGSTLLRGLKYLLKAGIFFLPRRKLLIEIMPAPEDFPRNGARLDINRYLENWYNQYPVNSDRIPTEPVNLVSYSPWKDKFLKLPKKENKKELGFREFSSKTEKEVIAEIARIAKVSEEQVNLKMDLAVDLGLDSLDLAEIVTFLSINYDVNEMHPEDIETVQDVLEIAEGIKTTTKRQVEEVNFKWPEEKSRPKSFIPEGTTLQEVFLRSCDRMKNHFAIADDMVGPLTYKRLKLSALVLSKQIQKMPGKHIGILLPASVGTYLIILATLLAGKIPVMLNWTLGPRFLNSMMQTSNAKQVISSWKFLEKLGNTEFGHLTKNMHLLEDLKKKVSKSNKISAALLSLKSTKGIMKALRLNKISENDPAVILFTSGTEANPKGVPLTHKNILSNQRAALEAGRIEDDEVFYGILPPFHSFGFSIAGLLPIFAGLKIAYFPDPTDSYALADGIQRWQATLICSAPSFLKGLLQAATPEQLKSIRLFVAGAEKTPKELFEKVKKLGDGKTLIEGYGITECSPVISLNDQNGEPRGVGKLVPGFELAVIDPETEEVIPNDQEGEICVKGPSVFSGYLGKQKSPFIEINGERWYRTGDLGYLDKDGNIILSGRLKRFVKMAGEMVSLGGIEEVISEEILRRTGHIADGPISAVCADEIEGDRPSLVLFSVVDIDKKEINMILKEAGFSRLVKISDVKIIEEIPLMGTGKIDYRYLQTMIE